MIPSRVAAWAIAVAALAILQSATSAHAQGVQATLRASQGLPPGQVQAPSSPAGAVVIGADLYIGDGNQGLRHFIPADPANPDPINSGALIFDIDQSHSI